MRKKALLSDEVFEDIAIKQADDTIFYIKEYIKTENPAVLPAESTTTYIKNLATKHYHIDRGEITPTTKHLYTDK